VSLNPDPGTHLRTAAPTLAEVAVPERASPAERDFTSSRA